jgi:hypothetical protein
MYRCFAALVTILSILSVLAILTVPSAAQAYTIYDFSATPTKQTGPHVVFEFTLQYEDMNKDGRFSLSELIPGSFSGFTYVYVYDPVPWEIDRIYQVPKYQATVSPLTDGWPSYPPDWMFVRTFDNSLKFFRLPPALWTYSQAAVPIPPTAVMLGTGLIWLVWTRRKKRRGP